MNPDVVDQSFQHRSIRRPGSASSDSGHPDHSGSDHFVPDHPGHPGRDHGPRAVDVDSSDPRPVSRLRQRRYLRRSRFGPLAQPGRGGSHRSGVGVQAQNLVRTPMVTPKAMSVNPRSLVRRLWWTHLLPNLHHRHHHLRALLQGENGFDRPWIHDGDDSGLPRLRQIDLRLRSDPPRVSCWSTMKDCSLVQRCFVTIRRRWNHLPRVRVLELVRTQVCRTWVSSLLIWHSHWRIPSMARPAREVLASRRCR